MVLDEFGYLPFARSGGQPLFPLAHPCVASVLSGIDRPERLAQTLACYRFAIPDAFRQALAVAGVMRSDAPLHASGQGRGKPTMQAAVP
ncbi:hypothetical protein ASG37_06770 [Sphingomonas sp. Leaf407]|nr:hypothetical protein ASE97_04060 [Sphingomonas sp. Leaf42]KQT28561.1 hypothetical protein ASG37_06770 [Sphingomonas sp. Leaf407]